ncbi:MAG TPA: hypothetical protein VKU85_17335, partial [bacterium]|nr:hypothetical protein [bacterium]
MSRARDPDRLRLWVSAGIVLVMALAIVGYARWLAWDQRPAPGGDLDVPLLFGREELRWEHLVADADPGVPILCYHYFRPGLTPGRLLRVLG